jgi:hypothetical protein
MTMKRMPSNRKTKSGMALSRMIWVQHNLEINRENEENSK